MKLKVRISDFNQALNELSKDYRIFAPKRFPYMGTCSDTDLIRYDEVSSYEEMVWDEKSNFSAKEAFLPINQVLFYFTEDEFKVTSENEKGLIVFLRACDLNGVKRIDEIYLRNGIDKDFFYKRVRDKVKFVLVGCKNSFRNCFCVSMGTNKCEEYDAAMNVGSDYISMDIIDPVFNVFKGEPTDFTVDYVEKNLFKIEVPEKVDINALRNHEMWNEYDTRCIACGRCNYTCPTCTCFNMQDIYYTQNKNVGERRRVWASCQVDGYTNIAGGHSFRQKNGQRMRFKVMHKIADFKERFGYNMCVGCGRCDDACPQYISFSTSIEKVNAAMKELEEKNKK